jgi:hypothetical protein
MEVAGGWFTAALWLVLGATITVTGLRARHHERSRRVAVVAVAFMWVVGGALVNLLTLVQGGDYSGFADGSPSTFVTDTWESLVVPHAAVVIGLLVGFEAVAGLLVLVPGRTRQVALGLLVAFDLLLVSFGWGFLLWTVPVTAGLVGLWYAERAGVPDRSAPSAATPVTG